MQFVSRDPVLYLEDIKSSCKKILSYTKDMDFAEFKANSLVYDAVLRNLEIIGEAAKNVPDEFKNQYDEVEWRAAAALRNILAHAYFTVKDEIIWDVIANKIPVLLTQTTDILNQRQ